MPSTLDIDASSRKPILRAAAQDFSLSDIFVVERDGEMPSNATPSTVMDTSSSPTVRGSLPKFAHLSSIAPYETPDDTRMSTPEPIKVVRSKKKTTGEKDKKDKKKKRPATTASGDL